MIGTIVKFRQNTRDWNYIVEFEQTNNETKKTELVTLRTNSHPVGELIRNAHKVAKLALEYSGLQTIIDAVSSRAVFKELKKLDAEVNVEHLERVFPTVRFTLSSITWATGDDPGTRIEVAIVSQINVKGKVLSAESKLILPKIDSREESEFTGTLTGKIWQPVPNSVKNEYLIAVNLLQDQVQSFVGGEVEQAELFNPTELQQAVR